MTFDQEDALYDFLENTNQVFDLEMIVSYLRMVEPRHISHLADEVRQLLDNRNMAFRLGNRQWITRRGCFEDVPFVINPTRLELRNGILIPGHRCVPFANPVLLPHEYSFCWQGEEILFTIIEGEPDEFYPYYGVFGEEYAPQYIARDNPENEAAFNCDPYEDPPEVAIRALDMRNIYRETSFVPGDRFVVRTIDWKKGVFSLERTGAKEWNLPDLYSWFEIAEAGFEDSFKNLGPGISTEEQIAYAYWYGGGRMREIPAYSLEEFLYEKTERIEVVPYGIETRFWPAGREIPDLKGLGGFHAQPRKTDMEIFLEKKRIPLSELALRSYILDYLFRGEFNISSMIDRIIPPLIKITIHELKYIENYINIELAEVSNNYSPFTDKQTGPVRQRICELHTAVIELAFKLENEKIDSSWLPKHTFIILSQIQSHVLGIMEELDNDESPMEMELEAIDNSLDSMIETYEEMRLLIDEAVENYRKNKFSLVKAGPGKCGEWLLQLTIGGTDVWRRLMLSEDSNLEALHKAIQSSFGWNNSWIYQFRGEEILSNSITLKELAEKGYPEFIYEYGAKWTVRIILLNRYKANGEKSIRCVTGAGAAPPENIGGPLRFKRIISALSKRNDFERLSAERELGRNYNPDNFDMEACNRSLNASFSVSAVSSEREENNNE
jgi:hypothetical protein